MRTTAAALLIALASMAAAVAQERPPAPTPRTWSTEGREPQWRARFEASDGVIDGLSVLQRDADGIVVAVVENKDETKTTFIERRDRAGQAIWRHTVPGLPEKYTALNVFAVDGKGRADLTLVAVFNVDNPKPGDAFARIVEVDIRTGTLRIAGGFPYPRKKRDTPDDWMELTNAKVLPSGLIAFYGGVGSGPFFWWVGLRKPDGTVIWDVVSQRGVGQVVDLRPDGDGVELSVVNIMSRDGERGTGSFRVRIDAAGKILSSLRLWRRESGPRFTPDGGMAYVVFEENRPTVIEMLDRFGRKRLVRTLPDSVYGVDRCLDDGAIVLSQDKGALILAPDGNSMIVIPTQDYGTSILPDGAVAELSPCEGTACKVRTLSLFERPR